MIRSLSGIPFNTLFDAFSEAFRDYEMQLNEAELQAMLVRRGFDPELSFGAFDADRLVAFTFNGIGDFQGIPTAYDTGTGTIPGYRGRGLASEIFLHSVPALQKAGIRQYLLEVLQHNEKAVSLYKKLGFEVSREFNYFKQDLPGLTPGAAKHTPDLRIVQGSMTDVEALRDFCDFEASWQNSFASVSRQLQAFDIQLAIVKDRPVGYCIFEPFTGDLTQLAVSPEYRRRGIASALLLSALQKNQYSGWKVINVEPSCDNLTAFLQSFGMDVTGRQYEMIKAL